MSRADEDLPKGMALPEAPASRPAPLSLAVGNYAGAIRQALDILPVEIQVDRLLVLEQAGRLPRVRLALTILGEKGGVGHERNGDEVQRGHQELRSPGG